MMRMPQLLNVKTTVFAVAFFGVVACGQNASVTRSEDPSPAPAQAQEVAGLGVSDVVVGKDGKNGKDGCGLTVHTAVFYAKSMTKDERALYRLPYRSTKARPIKTLQIGEMTGHGPGGLAFVHNSQVVFAIDAFLPPAEAVKSIRRATFEFSLQKLSGDNIPNTEMLCFLDRKLCSGYRYASRSWVQHLNPGFWGKSEPANRIFAERDLGHFVGKMSERNLWASEATFVDIKDLIVGTAIKDEKTFLYEGLLKDRNVVRTLPMVVTDDTFVRSARLILDMEVDTCVSAELNRH